MKIKRSISLLVSALILMTTVINEPLSLLSVQAAEISESEGAIIENGEDPTQADEAVDNETTDTEVADGEDNDSEDVDNETSETNNSEDGGNTTDIDADETESSELEEPVSEEQESEELELEENPSRLARAAGDITINTTTFPDKYFRAYVSEKLDGNKDGILSKAEIDGVTWVDVNEWKYIESLKGVEYFTNLIGLSCYDNMLKSVDLSKNTELRTLSISNNYLTSLDLSKNTKLTSLTCNNNRLTSLNLSQHTQLTHLECQSNGLSSLDLSKNTKLDWLDCSNNNISSLNLSANTKLDYVVCANNKLTSLDISKNDVMLYLNCGNNQLTSLNTSGNTGIYAIECQNNKIASLNLTNNTNLIQLLCSNNALSVLEIPNSINANLEYLEFEGQTGMKVHNVNVKATSDMALNATWSAVPGATGYELYRCDKTYSNWERVVTKEISGTSYKDAKVLLGETYKYKLYAFQKTATAKRYLTYSSASNDGNVAVPLPQKVKTSISTATSIDISWDKVSQASGYTVYMSTSKNGTYKSIGNTTSNSLKNTNLKPGTTYYYKIRAYVQLGPSKVYSGYTAVTSRKQIVPKVTDAKVTNSGANSLKLSWKKVSDASGYEIYQATSKNGKYKKIATIKKGGTASYNVKKLSHKKTYYFKIRAYRTVGKTNKKGAFCGVIGKKVVLVKPVLTAKAKNKTSISLSWKKVSGAKTYEVYRATSKKGTYKKIATTKSLKFTNTKLKKNKKYFYKIKAVQKVGNTTYRSAYSTVRSAKTKK